MPAAQNPVGLVDAKLELFRVYGELMSFARPAPVIPHLTRVDVGGGQR